MYKSTLEEDLKKAITNLGFTPPDTVLTISENPKFGDYSSNVALQLAKGDTEKNYHSPKDIANAILEKLGHPGYLTEIQIAGVGFINFFLKDSSLISLLEDFSLADSQREKQETSKRYLVEYAHPNTHKAFHIGHLRNISIGESIARLLEYQGNEVFRVTYGGDIGPHVAKALWGLMKSKPEFEEVKEKSLKDKAEFLGKVYALGSAAYQDDKKAKAEIDNLNRDLYQKDPKLIPVWEETKKWSMAYFDTIYARVGTEFDGQIWESEVEVEGKKIVESHLHDVFKKDDGAIIFPGEKYNLHNRVFITSKGYPTYEGKEMGLTQKERELFPFDFSLHIVANEQASFFEVVTKAYELIEPDFKGKKKHLSYGLVKLASGKMSSRTGDIITSDFLINQVIQKIKQTYHQSQVVKSDSLVEKIAIGAIKFSYLKYSLHSDITFDIEESISLQGDSGPYLLYTFARINSLLNRAPEIVPEDEVTEPNPRGIAQNPVEEEEREILRLLEYFETYAKLASTDFKPNEICNYLLTLAKAFNLFYEKYSILGSEKVGFRIALSSKTGDIIKLGLYLLGIETLERM